MLQIAGPFRRHRFVRIGEIEIDRIVAQARRLPQRARAEVPVVVAALADLVDHAADRAPVFGAVAADERLLLFDGAVRQADAALALSASVVFMPSM